MPDEIALVGSLKMANIRRSIEKEPPVASASAISDQTTDSSIHADLEVVTHEGLHMRVASKIVRLAMAFESAIEIRFNDTIANAKSMIDILTLAAERGSRLHVTAKGKDAAMAIHQILTGLPPEDVRPAPEK